MRLFMFRKLMYVQKTVHVFAIYKSYVFKEICIARGN